MSTLKTVSACICLFAVTAVSAPLAFAQDVIVFDAGRVFTDSKAGKDLQTKVSTIETTMQNELAPDGQAIKTEQNALAAKSNGKTMEQIQADATLVAQGKALAEKMKTYQAKTQKRARELAATERTALAVFSQKMRAAVEKVRAKHNSKIVIDSSNVYMNVDGVDVTTEIILQLDADSPTVTVQRVTLQPQAAAQPQ